MDVRGGWTARARTPAIVGAAAMAFAAHAACYLYFFVDDSAIPAVYAQNLLAGRGFVYTALEGRVEGYSDFLHVLITTALLALTRALHVPKIEVLHLGMALSFALGVGVVVLTGMVLARAGAPPAAVAAGAGAIATAGPLAVWSCVSLETVPFAFVMAALAAATIFEPLRPRAAVALGVLAILYRLDGFVFVAAVLAGALVAAEGPTRRLLIARVIVPTVLAAVAYQALRVAYFHRLLSAPLEAKVLYKLSPSRHVIVKAPGESYLHSFIDLYGLAIVPAVLLAAASVVRQRRGRGLVLAVAIMTLYVDIVGDWMFGWRFLVPVLPLGAVLIGLATARLRSRTAWAVAAIVVVWGAIGARVVAREFVDTQHKPLWWTSPHDGQTMWLAPYGDLARTARGLVSPGETIAYNQAGLIPFLLDVENIDDLGICSSFEARLPTTDVYFTEVGRYAPLTDAPVFGAAQAYLLYRDVRALISRTDLLMNANGGQIPKAVLDGYFQLHSVDASGENAIYVRTARQADAYRRDPSLFQEDLLHTSRIERAELDGTLLPEERIGPAFPFLRWGTGRLTVQGTSSLVLRFASRDEDVATIYAGSISASTAVAVTFKVFDEAGREVASEAAQADAFPRPLLRRLPAGVRGRIFVLEARAAAPNAALTISDLRLNGQSAALRKYVTRALAFPTP